MREPEPKSPEKGPKDPIAEANELRSRLEALKAGIGQAHAAESDRNKSRSDPTSNGGALGMGLRAGSELVAGVLVGCGIGYVIDRQAGTSPIFLIIFLMMGMAAGFWNVYRMATRKPGLPAADRKNSASGADE
ncbi:MAG TPA: AtpZ/AtpI family protein [Rhabdaerophilum sp.]|nr:AtpZ/AtpI family protein [Rhabdaerophilum sp.]